MDSISFAVFGIPRGQGSMKWVISKTTGKPVPIVPKNLKQWRKQIGERAAVEMRERRFLSDVSIQMAFSFARPKNHYRTGKYSHLYKDSAPNSHTQKPDTDKLIRAVLDALTGVCYADDCQVNRIVAVKKWYPTSMLECRLRGVLYAVQEG